MSGITSVIAAVTTKIEFVVPLTNIKELHEK